MTGLEFLKWAKDHQDTVIASIDNLKILGTFTAGRYDNEHDIQHKDEYDIEVLLDPPEYHGLRNQLTNFHIEMDLRNSDPNAKIVIRYFMPNFKCMIAFLPLKDKFDEPFNYFIEMLMNNAIPYVR